MVGQQLNGHEKSNGLIAAFRPREKSPRPDSIPPVSTMEDMVPSSLPLSQAVTASASSHTTHSPTASLTIVTDRTSVGENGDDLDSQPLSSLLFTKPTAIPSSALFPPTDIPSPLPAASSTSSSPPCAQPFVPSPPFHLPGLRALLSPSPPVLPTIADVSPSLPLLPSVLPVGPQRVLAPTRIASSLDGGAGSGLHSTVAGSAWDGIAADGGDGQVARGVEVDSRANSGEGDSEVEIIKAVIHAAPHPPPTPGPLTLPELQGLPYSPLALSTMGGGRCPIAAPMLAMRKLPDAHITSAYRRVIDKERLSLGACMAETWCEEKWVREVPLIWRMSRVCESAHGDLATARTSYVVFKELLSDKDAAR